MSKLTMIKDYLLNGDITILTHDNVQSINKMACAFLKMDIDVIGEPTITDMKDIIEISNILYNNTDRSILPLEDGVYDILLCKYKQINPNYLVGAVPVNFEQQKPVYDPKTEPIIPAYFADIEKINDSWYLNDGNILKDPKLTRDDSIIIPGYIEKDVIKKNVNVSHNYPKLVGTLEKCKFVLNSQARDKDVFDKPNVQVFERDFLGKHLKMGLFDTFTELELVAELKYDGISVEADVSNRVISARSRGDTAQDLAADLTPILADYPFRHASNVRDEDTFGMKFEAIVTNDNLLKISELRNTEYKNARNAVIGLFGSLDGYIYRDCITLVPLATSLEGMNRIQEIEFMNKYYHSGEILRYAVLRGTYTEILYQVNKFVQEAEYIRPYMPFMYDGVVISYTDPKLISTLGRFNSINQYSIAIKFNPLKKQTIFNGYTFTVGQTGSITPMIHFNPVEFYGAIQDHASGHSLNRFHDLGLRVGDIIDVDYQHDVMAYVTKPDNEANRSNINPVIPFITECPSCGTKLMYSEKAARCPNIKCPDRIVARMTNMIQKLNIKDFSEETIRALDIHSLTDLLNLTLEDVAILGEANSNKFMDRMYELKKAPIEDYNIFGALGFTNIGAAKWKVIFSIIHYDLIRSLPEYELRSMLSSIKGIGYSTIDSICYERLTIFPDDLVVIYNMPNIVSTTGIGTKSGKSIRFTGIRDPELESYLQSMGYDADGKASVTKSTDILIVPYDGFSSVKTSKVGSDCIIVGINTFRENMNMYLQNDIAVEERATMMLMMDDSFLKYSD